MVTLIYHGNSIGPIVKRIASESGDTIRAIQDTALPARIEGTVIRWDSRARVLADKTLNTVEAVKLSKDKKAARIAMAGLCPTTWTKFSTVQYPALFRPMKHFAASKFFVCKDQQEGIRATKRCGFQRWYASPIIQKKLEYRVFVFQGHILKVVRRFHKDPTQVAWNIANGGGSVKVSKKNWPIAVCRQAILAGRRIGLDWFAADVIVDNDDKPYVLELNTAPGLQKDMTIEMLAYIFSWAGENPPPADNPLTGSTWQEFIHPGLRDEA